MKIIDCSGLSCPVPVLRTKEALKDYPFEDLIIVIDNVTARDNVMRFIGSKGLYAEWQEKDGSFHINVTGSKTVTDNTPVEKVLPGGTTHPVLLIASDQLGQGSRELGLLLLRNFIYTLTKQDQAPRAIVLMNGGVKLSIDGSPVIEELEDLIAKDVAILVCGTCLDYFELKEKHRAGQVSNMYDIADLLLTSEKVITV